jgi:hypothetical protein
MRIGLIGVPESSAALVHASPHWGALNMALTSVWDSDMAKAEAFAKQSSIRTVQSYQSLLKIVDGLLVSPGVSLGNAGTWVEPVLGAGIPVWIDGPLAPSMAQAKKLIAVAERGKTAVMAASIEEFFAATTFLRRKAAQLRPITAAMVAVSTTGKQKFDWSGVEAVNVLCAIFGPSAGKVTRIVAPSEEQNYTITVEYGDLKGNRPLHIVAQGIPQTASRLWGRIYGMDMVDREHLFSDDAAEDWTHSILPAALAFQEMVRTRKAPQDSTYLLAKTRLYLAACRSTEDPDGRQLAVGDLADNWSVGG